MTAKLPVAGGAEGDVWPQNDSKDVLGTRPPQALASLRSGGPDAPRILESRDLLDNQHMVLIRHLGELYRLQTTRQGKLILTK